MQLNRTDFGFTIFARWEDAVRAAKSANTLDPAHQYQVRDNTKGAFIVQAFQIKGEVPAEDGQLVGFLGD